ncbi:hypothetical protein R1flu_026009 [Riccia fluitans]|uniref:U3 small nucleolar ribonucleoprotein protein MPP10 n=1 Tax=Riccia fluitans TaxID=41844 RepID=A0ABD1XHR7_9MARC
MGGIAQLSREGAVDETAKVEKKSTEIDSVAGQALDRLKTTEAIDWLGTSSSLAECTKQASEGLFSLTATNFEKAPLKKLYTDRFDTEQIWQQIDLQSLPVLSYIRRRVKILEKASIDNYFVLPGDSIENVSQGGEDDLVKDQELTDGTGSSSEGEDEDTSDGSDVDRDEAEGEGLEEEDDEEDDVPKNPVEDEFFKISEMEKFLDKADAEENGFSVPSGSDEEENEDDEDLDAAEAGFSGDDGEDEDGNGLGFGKYEEFFGMDKKRKVKFNLDEQNDVDNSDEDGGSEDGDIHPSRNEIMPVQEDKLSAHEKRLLKTKKRIEALEKANIDPKDWTMQGEVSARKRPKNSALEVELDFDHNARPPPVITEEVTASLEDMIKARIAETRFDDVVRSFVGPEAAPRERIELDENKSQKGLGALYEADYMRQTGSAVAPTTSTDLLKNEATLLFRALCSRLDALSHFSFAPKPVIEDMGVRADVPALAMEEVAPLLVSEASLLAPEEVFKGEDGLKGEAELSPEERKRRRAQKKRKRKGEKRAQEQLELRKKPRVTGSTDEPKSTPGLKIGHSSFSKSTKVFAALDNTVDGKGKPVPRKDEKQLPRASDLKL